MSALQYNDTHSENVAVGYYAGRDVEDDYMVYVGSLAGYERQTGDYNVGIGYKANGGDSAVAASGAGNTCVGAAAGMDLETETYATFIGYQAGLSNKTGSNNVAVGRNAGYGTTTGSQNTFVGALAGDTSTSGSNNTKVGYQARGSTATVSNEITLGNSSVATLRCQVTSITALSDERDKTNIEPLEAGLEFVEQLDPVSFTWNMRDGGKVGVEDTGFIAQDLQQVQEDTGITIPNLVYDENPDKLEAAYGKLIPVLVKAIQELSAKVEDLESQLNS